MTASHPDKRFLPLLQDRLDGNARCNVFRSGVVALREHLELLENPQISSSHNGSISTLDIDYAEGRFLLAAGADATVSIYDLSLWGTERHLTGISTGRQIHKPVAKSIRALSTNNQVEVPSGHSHSLVAAQWYPVDTGAFVSASAEGYIFVWDTHTMTPVASYRPFTVCRCFHMSRHSGVSQSLMAVGSEGEKIVKLVDLRSGAASHTLIGHKGGISNIQWSPTCDVVLASGSIDGSIALWDIRKSGSNACITFMDQDATPDRYLSGKYLPTYGHLRPRRSNTKTATAPGNYRNVESSTAQSHGGPISSLFFCPDGHFLVSTGRDGKLHHWDLRIGKLAPTHYFAVATHQPAVRKNRRVPLVVTQTTSEAMAWVGHGEDVLGYSLDHGGRPTQTLEGHLHNITALTIDEAGTRLITGGKDGMILVWGCKSLSSRKFPVTSEGIGGTKRTQAYPVEDRDFW